MSTRMVLLKCMDSEADLLPGLKQRSPNIVRTQCVIHRRVLASRTLPATINSKLAIAIPVVNFVKNKPCQIEALYCSVHMDADHKTVVPRGYILNRRL